MTTPLYLKSVIDNYWEENYLEESGFSHMVYSYRVYLLVSWICSKQSA